MYPGNTSGTNSRGESGRLRGGQPNNNQSRETTQAVLGTASTARATYQGKSQDLTQWGAAIILAAWVLNNEKPCHRSSSILSELGKRADIRELANWLDSFADKQNEGGIEKLSLKSFALSQGNERAETFVGIIRAGWYINNNNESQDETAEANNAKPENWRELLRKNLEARINAWEREEDQVRARFTAAPTGLRDRVERYGRLSEDEWLTQTDIDTVLEYVRKSFSFEDKRGKFIFIPASSEMRPDQNDISTKLYESFRQLPAQQTNGTNGSVPYKVYFIINRGGFETIGNNDIRMSNSSNHWVFLSIDVPSIKESDDNENSSITVIYQDSLPLGKNGRTIKAQIRSVLESLITDQITQLYPDKKISITLNFTGTQSDDSYSCGYQAAHALLQTLNEDVALNKGIAQAIDGNEQDAETDIEKIIGLNLAGSQPEQNLKTLVELINEIILTRGHTEAAPKLRAGLNAGNSSEKESGSPEYSSIEDVLEKADNEASKVGKSDVYSNSESDASEGNVHTDEGKQNHNRSNNKAAEVEIITKASASVEHSHEEAEPELPSLNTAKQDSRPVYHGWFSTQARELQQSLATRFSSKQKNWYAHYTQPLHEALKLKQVEKADDHLTDETPSSANAEDAITPTNYFKALTASRVSVYGRRSISGGKYSLKSELNKRRYQFIEKLNAQDTYLAGFYRFIGRISDTEIKNKQFLKRIAPAIFGGAGRKSSDFIHQLEELYYSLLNDDEINGKKVTILDILEKLNAVIVNSNDRALIKKIYAEIKRLQAINIEAFDQALAEPDKDPQHIAPLFPKTVTSVAGIKLLFGTRENARRLIQAISKVMDNEELLSQHKYRSLVDSILTTKGLAELACTELPKEEINQLVLRYKIKDIIESLFKYNQLNEQQFKDTFDDYKNVFDGYNDVENLITKAMELLSTKDPETILNAKFIPPFHAYLEDRVNSSSEVGGQHDANGTEGMIGKLNQFNKFIESIICKFTLNKVTKVQAAINRDDFDGNNLMGFLLAEEDSEVTNGDYLKAKINHSSGLRKKLYESVIVEIAKEKADQKDYDWLVEFLSGDIVYRNGNEYYPSNDYQCQDVVPILRKMLLDYIDDNAILSEEKFAYLEKITARKSVLELNNNNIVGDFTTKLAPDGILDGQKKGFKYDWLDTVDKDCEHGGSATYRKAIDTSIKSMVVQYINSLFIKSNYERISAILEENAALKLYTKDRNSEVSLGGPIDEDSNVVFNIASTRSHYKETVAYGNKDVVKKLMHDYVQELGNQLNALKTGTEANILSRNESELLRNRNKLLRERNELRNQFERIVSANWRETFFPEQRDSLITAFNNQAVKSRFRALTRAIDKFNNGNSDAMFEIIKIIAPQIGARLGINNEQNQAHNLISLWDSLLDLVEDFDLFIPSEDRINLINKIASLSGPSGETNNKLISPIIISVLQQLAIDLNEREQHRQSEGGIATVKKGQQKEEDVRLDTTKPRIKEINAKRLSDAERIKLPNVLGPLVFINNVLPLINNKPTIRSDISTLLLGIIPAKQKKHAHSAGNSYNRLPALKEKLSEIAKAIKQLAASPSDDVNSNSLAEELTILLKRLEVVIGKIFTQYSLPYDSRIQLLIPISEILHEFPDGLQRDQLLIKSISLATNLTNITNSNGIKIPVQVQLTDYKTVLQSLKLFLEKKPQPELIQQEIQNIAANIRSIMKDEFIRKEGVTYEQRTQLLEGVQSVLGYMPENLSGVCQNEIDALRDELHLHQELQAIYEYLAFDETSPVIIYLRATSMRYNVKGFQQLESKTNKQYIEQIKSITDNFSRLLDNFSDKRSAEVLLNKLYQDIRIFIQKLITEVNYSQVDKSLSHVPFETRKRLIKFYVPLIEKISDPTQRQELLTQVNNFGKDIQVNPRTFIEFINDAENLENLTEKKYPSIEFIENLAFNALSTSAQPTHKEGDEARIGTQDFYQYDNNADNRTIDRGAIVSTIARRLPSAEAVSAESTTENRRLTGPEKSLAKSTSKQPSVKQLEPITITLLAHIKKVIQTGDSSKPVKLDIENQVVAKHMEDTPITKTFLQTVLIYGSEGQIITAHNRVIAEIKERHNKNDSTTGVMDLINSYAGALEVASAHGRTFDFLTNNNNTTHNNNEDIIGTEIDSLMAKQKYLAADILNAALGTMARKQRLNHIKRADEHISTLVDSLNSDEAWKIDNNPLVDIIEKFGEEKQFIIFLSDISQHVSEANKEALNGALRKRYNNLNALLKQYGIKPETMPHSKRNNKIGFIKRVRPIKQNTHNKPIVASDQGINTGAYKLICLLDKHVYKPMNDTVGLTDKDEYYALRTIRNLLLKDNSAWLSYEVNDNLPNSADRLDVLELCWRLLEGHESPAVKSAAKSEIRALINHLYSLYLQGGSQYHTHSNIQNAATLFASSNDIYHYNVCLDRVARMIKASHVQPYANAAESLELKRKTNPSDFMVMCKQKITRQLLLAYFSSEFIGLIGKFMENLDATLSKIYKDIDEIAIDELVYHMIEQGISETVNFNDRLFLTEIQQLKSQLAFDGAKQLNNLLELRAAIFIATRNLDFSVTAIRSLKRVEELLESQTTISSGRDQGKVTKASWTTLFRKQVVYLIKELELYQEAEQEVSHATQNATKDKKVFTTQEQEANDSNNIAIGTLNLAFICTNRYHSIKLQEIFNSILQEISQGGVIKSHNRLTEIKVPSIFILSKKQKSILESKLKEAALFLGQVVNDSHKTSCTFKDPTIAAIKKLVDATIVLPVISYGNEKRISGSIITIQELCEQHNAHKKLEFLLTKKQKDEEDDEVFYDHEDYEVYKEITPKLIKLLQDSPYKLKAWQNKVLIEHLQGKINTLEKAIIAENQRHNNIILSSSPAAQVGRRSPRTLFSFGWLTPKGVKQERSAVAPSRQSSVNINTIDADKMLSPNFKLLVQLWHVNVALDSSKESNIRLKLDSRLTKKISRLKKLLTPPTDYNEQQVDLLRNTIKDRAIEISGILDYVRIFGSSYHSIYAVELLYKFHQDVQLNARNIALNKQYDSDENKDGKSFAIIFTHFYQPLAEGLNNIGVDDINLYRWLIEASFKPSRIQRPIDAIVRCDLGSKEIKQLNEQYAEKERSLIQAGKTILEEKRKLDADKRAQQRRAEIQNEYDSKNNDPTGVTQSALTKGLKAHDNRLKQKTEATTLKELSRKKRKDYLDNQEKLYRLRAAHSQARQDIHLRTLSHQMQMLAIAIKGLLAEENEKGKINEESLVSKVNMVINELKAYLCREGKNPKQINQFIKTLLSNDANVSDTMANMEKLLKDYKLNNIYGARLLVLIAQEVPGILRACNINNTEILATEKQPVARKLNFSSKPELRRNSASNIFRRPSNSDHASSTPTDRDNDRPQRSSSRPIGISAGQDTPCALKERQDDSNPAMQAQSYIPNNDNGRKNLSVRYNSTD